MSFGWIADQMKHTGNISNLLSVGRNGEFSHMFMEDVYGHTLKKVKKLVDQINYD